MIINDFFEGGKLFGLKIGDSVKKLKKIDGLLWEMYKGGFDGNSNLFDLHKNDIRVTYGFDLDDKLKFITLSFEKNFKINFFLTGKSIPVNKWKLIDLKSYLFAEKRTFIIEEKLNGIIKVIKIENPALEIVYSYEDDKEGEICIVSSVIASNRTNSR